MTFDTKIRQLIQCFVLPEQDLKELEFCQDHRVQAVLDWASELPATRISNTSVLLYKALPEIVKLKTSVANRLAMLEGLRPYVQGCIQGLASNFLNQPLILPEGAMKTAVIAQALQKHMTNGYLVALLDLLPKKLEGTANAQEENDLSLVLHRAITGLGLQYLRSAQLYAPAPSQLWSQINALYFIAESFEFLKTQHSDELLKAGSKNSIEQSYIRTLMLASAQPNQLRQNDLLSLYDALETWSHKLSLSTARSDKNNIFVIDLSVNQGPIYRARYEGDESSTLRELDFTSVLFSLEKLQSGHAEEGFAQISGALALVIYGHVKDSWGVARQRASKRLSSHSRLEVVIGLGAIHYHATDTCEFSNFLLKPVKTDRHSLKSNRFAVGKSASEQDPWGGAHDVEGMHQGMVNLDFSYDEDESTVVSSAEKYLIYQTITLDASSEGYCLDWRESIPANVRVGELLGIREKGRKFWAVGVIRWVRQNKGASQIGVKMLSPQIKPYAVKKLHKSGDEGDYMRALIIPEFKAAKYPSTIVTPVLPFKAGDKIVMNEYGELEKAQLIKREFYTSAINQFTYRSLEVSEKPSSVSSDDDFSGEW